MSNSKKAPKRRAGRQPAPVVIEARSADRARKDASNDLVSGNLAAASAWARLVALESASAEDLWLATKIQTRSGDFAAAHRTFDRLLNLYPANAMFWYGRACCLAESGDAEAAEAAFDAVPAADDETVVDWTLFYASALEQGGAAVLALGRLATLTAAHPQRLVPAIDLVRMEIRQGRAVNSAKRLQALLTAPQDVPAAAIMHGWMTVARAMLHDSPADAEAAYQSCLAIDPLHAKARTNLALLLTIAGRNDEATVLLEETCRLLPDCDDAHYLLAANERLADLFDAAIARLQKLVNTTASHDAGWELLARCQAESGRHEAAVETCRRWKKLRPDCPAAKHMLAALSGEAAPDRADATYVASTFDRFADKFEAVLKQLNYQGPALFQQLLTDTLGEPAGQLAVLDAGCGTGLLGPVLRPWASQLEGVDLSPKMLERARWTGSYDDLRCGDLVEDLKRHPATWDVILAADTLNYFGALDGVLRAAFAALRPDGWLVFSVEEGDLTGDSWSLQPHGRYAHAPAYLIEQLGELGVPSGDMRRAVLRKENDRPVYGLLIAVRKP